MSDSDRGLADRAVYAATASDARVTFSRQEKQALFRALLDVVPPHRAKLRIFTPLCAAYALWRQYTETSFRPRPCLGGTSFFFVNNQGETFPCGYRGTENLGPFHQFDPASRSADTPCLACDWECFRDPSELFGPITDILAGPSGWRRLLRTDATQRRLWLTDLRYFAACDFFDGRRPPNPAKLARFAS